MIEQFHFLRPAWLLVFLPMGALLWYLIKGGRLSRNWQAVVDPALLSHLLAGQVQLRKNWSLVMTGLGATLAVIALAGPVWEKLPQPVFKQQSALVIALDVSRSMDANDIKPSRLTRARHKITDILSQRDEGQTALIAYAAEAFVVTPLTDDDATINALLPSLSTDIMPTQGSRADRALIQAYILFENSGIRRGDILLVSDGFSESEIYAMDLLLDQNPNFRVSVLGIGSEQGGPIPLANGGFLKDAEGAIVIPRMPLDRLRKMARAGNGVFRSISAGDQDIQGILNAMKTSRFEQEAIASDQSADIWYEQGPWLILILLPFAALAFRRGVLMVLPLVLVLHLPQVEASAWDSLWQNSDQRARLQFDRGEHQQAAETFDDPGWKGSSWYRVGDYDRALQYWDLQNSESAYYNRGNALAKLNRFEDAIKAYEQVLEQNPQHRDARYNKKLLEDALQQQQDQQSKQQQGDESKQPSESDQNQQSDKAGQGEQQSESEAQPSGQQDSDSAQAKNSRELAETESIKSEQSQPGEQNSSDAEGIASLDQKLSDQALEQWLRKIPDDPGGLLRRKFLYQYQNRGGAPTEEKPW
ncbi:MAG: VWA domain-containing protein [Proteobacteria bacterium]|nr:VWA domain-containing protein [Pseudomonadota bacterium]